MNYDVHYGCDRCAPPSPPNWSEYDGLTAPTISEQWLLLHFILSFINSLAPFCAGVEACEIGVLDLERKPRELILAKMAFSPRLSGSLGGAGWAFGLRNDLGVAQLIHTKSVS